MREWKQFLKEEGAKYIISAGSKGIAFFPEKKEIWLIKFRSVSRPNIEAEEKNNKQLAELKGNYKVKSYVFITYGRGKKAILDL